MTHHHAADVPPTLTDAEFDAAFITPSDVPEEWANDPGTDRDPGAWWDKIGIDEYIDFEKEG